ncbi:hypothetical protein, partial [Tritonibacter sp. SIMBA_163]|uniref:hypothetical protein n=1 Tax=Tritonibacter sp. SIMBA_163 TaxID=3080868 RepID=UPI0039805A11
QLIKVLNESFGSTGTLLIIGSVPAFFFILKLYNDRREDQKIDKLIKEKDQAIQRITDTAREWKNLYLKEIGWSTEEIERLTIKN